MMPYLYIMPIIIIEVIIYILICKIIWGDPGHITSSLQSEIFEKYGVDEQKIGVEYSIYEAADMCTE